ncbi:polysaccharide pyruvyl transferase family protein [Vibrio metschnikovii]|nr:polysaccharide pyruvyl transferase family protein [Vibrio metschnikovii]
MNTLFIGYYGYNNYGDDLMLMVLDSFSDHNSTVLTKTPLKEKLKLNSKEVVFKNFHVDFLKLLTSHKRVLWGGGTCFYSNHKNLIMLLIVTIITRLLNKDIVYFSVGVGKIEGKIDRFICKIIYKLSTQIYLRDKLSLEAVRSETNNRKGALVEDLFLLKNRVICESDNVYRSQKKVLFNLSVDCVEGIDIKGIIEVADELEEIYGISVEFISLQNEINSPEIKFYRNSNLILDKRFVSYDNNLELYKAISSSSLFIGFRLHGLLTAIVNSVPILAYPYSPKVDIMLSSFCSDNENVKLKMGSFPSVELILSSFNNHFYYNNIDEEFLAATEKKINEVLL